jgi:hypothetical protein
MNAKAPTATAPTRAAPDATADLAGLETWRTQARVYLERLSGLATRLRDDDVDQPLRADAGAIEAFFSETSRRHFAEVERTVLPPLLAGGVAARAEAARKLKQDHGWLEQNWLELAPQLRAVAEGNHWIDPAEFVHDVEVFEELCGEHLALEASLAGPTP